VEGSGGDLMLLFGSPSGSYFALSLFGILFAFLGWGCAREIRQRYPQLGRWKAAVPGLLLFLGPVALIYWSSLDGFYEAAVEGDELQLHYLLPGFEDAMPLSEVSRVEAEPAFKTRWRLHITRSTGERYESAPWNRQAVRESQERLRARLKLDQR
jgi:hypothetical protein